MKPQDANIQTLAITRQACDLRHVDRYIKFEGETCRIFNDSRWWERLAEGEFVIPTGRVELNCLRSTMQFSDDVPSWKKTDAHMIEVINLRNAMRGWVPALFLQKA